MNEIFRLFGTIGIDGVQEAENDINGVADSGEKAQSKLGAAFSKMGSAAVKAGKVIASGIAVGATAIGALTVKALSLSGELEQNMGGSEAVFAEYAQGMQETAESAFSNMGLATSDFLATANKMGALFQGSGFTIAESADMSSQAMQRAADVASIMGIDTATAMESIAGAAKGNFEMMDNLGVAMNDTTIGAYALSKGITKSTQQMTTQEKVGLAMEMFLEKTTYAAGNYAKENETLAGSLGTAKAALTNFLDGSGSVDDLVTSFTNAANVIVKNITEILPRLTTGLTEVVNGIVPLIPPLLDQLLPPLITGATQLINGIVNATPQILNALMGALPALISGIQQIFNALISALPQIMESLVSALPTLLPMLISALISMIITLVSNFSSIIQPIIDYLPEIIISIVDALMSNLPALIDGAVMLIVGIVNALPQISLALVQAIPDVIQSILSGLWEAQPTLYSGVLSIIKSLATAPFKALKSSKIPGVVSELWNKVKSIISIVVDWIKENWQTMLLFLISPLAGIFKVLYDNFDGFKNFVDGTINGIKEFFIGLWNSIIEIFTSIIEWVNENIIVPLTTFVETWIAPVIEKIIEIIAKLVEIAVALFKFLWDSIVSLFLTAAEWFNTNVIQPIIKFFKALWETVSGFFKSLWNDIIAIWQAVSGWFNNNVIQPVAGFFKGLWDSIKNLASDAWAGIKNTFSSIGTWFKEKFQDAVQKIKDVFNPIADFFGEIWNKIKEKFSALGTTIGDAIGGAVKEAINGVISLIEGTINKAIGLINGAIGVINKVPNVNISTISTLSMPRLAKGGIVDESTIANVGEDGAEAIVPLEKNLGWIDSIASKIKLAANYGDNGGNEYIIISKLNELIDEIKNLKIYLDTGVLVGEIVPAIDDGLGDISKMRERGR